jgi:hypothetical protein
MTAQGPHRARSALATVALAAAIGAAAASAAPGPISTTRDPVGDGHGAPDICDVAISKSASAVGFRITFADRRSLEPGERVSIVLDSDRNEATGNPYLGGADLLASYGTAGEKTFAGELLRWSGTRWELAPPDRGRARFQAGVSVLKVVLDRSLLRGRDVGWSVFTFRTGRARGSDSVPNDGMGAYRLRGEGRAEGHLFGPRRLCGPAVRRA